MIVSGIIRSFVPVMENGAQKTYTDKYGVKYKFNMTVAIDNGAEETGEVNSNKTNPSWTVGEHYSMDREVRGGQYICYSKLNNLDHPKTFGGQGGAPAPGGGQSYVKPDKLAFAKQKGVECAFEAASQLFLTNRFVEKEGVTLDMMYHQAVEAFCKWILSSLVEADIWSRVSAMHIVIGIDGVIPVVAPKDKGVLAGWLIKAETERQIFLKLQA